jgi:hypothetical protein
VFGVLVLFHGPTTGQCRPVFPLETENRSSRLSVIASIYPPTVTPLPSPPPRENPPLVQDIYSWYAGATADASNDVIDECIHTPWCVAPALGSKLA